MHMIVAHANQRVIGRGNSLPWKLPEDMQFFREMTLYHKNLLVGKNTLFSLPNQQLPKRNLHVLSRTHTSQGEEQVLRSLDEVLDLNKQTPLMVIGGQQIYETMLPFAHTLYITRIDLDEQGADTFFPEYESDFKLNLVAKEGISNDLNYRIEEWVRK